MKSIICTLAILCVIQVSTQELPDPTKILERLVNVQKLAIEAVLEDLTSFENRISQNIQLELNDMRSENLAKIDKMVNKALEEIKASVEAGKKEGKDVTHCFDDANRKINTANENAIAELETCVKNAQAAVDIPLENVKKTIEAANTFLNDLGAIIPNCYSPIFIKMQACVVGKLVFTRTTLKRLEGNARVVKTSTTLAYLNALISANNCMGGPVANIRTTSSDIVVNTNSCVRNAKKSDTIE